MAITIDVARPRISHGSGEWMLTLEWPARADRIAVDHHQTSKRFEEPAEIGMAKHFKIDARAVLMLGRESIKDHTTAVVELVKNSYDAGAKVVDVEIHANDPDPGTWFVRVADNGEGMSGEEVDANWLRIGFSEKRTRKTIRGRRKVGEKGIGRLSADRLGASLELRSQANGEKAVGLSVDWDRFDQPGTDLQKIAIDDLKDVHFLVPQPWTTDDDGNEAQVPGLPNSNNRTGTEMVIRNLRQVWVDAELEQLREELSILTPPFEAVDDFQVRIIVGAGAGAIVPSSFMETWEVSGTFRCDSNGNVSYTILERDKRGKEKEVDDGEVNWNELVYRKRVGGNSEKDGSKSKSEADEKPTFGPLEVRLMFFPRNPTALRSSAFSMTELRNFLEKNSGIRVYRDRVRVKPYGSPNTPDGDWLGLAGRKIRDPAGAARRTFKFAPNQVVGAVFLTRDFNPAIADSASREGLVHGRAFSELQDLVMGCMRLLETAYHEIYKKRLDEAPPPENPREKVKSLGEDLRSLASNLRDVKQAIPSNASRTVEKSLDHLQTTVERIEKTQRSIEELANREIVYRGLATLGIAATTFGHETQRTLHDAVMATSAAKVLLKAKQLDVDKVIREIDKAIKNSTTVAAWGAFALTRVRRDRRRKRSQPITPLIEKVIEGMRPSLEGSDVTVSIDLRSIQGSVFGMDIESVAINLLTNAYDFCKQKQRKRVISVSLKERSHDSRRGMELTVADTGPGVAVKFAERIWEPMFSTKKGEDGDQWGTGLGLTIIDAIVRDMGGMRSVDRDPELDGARFKIWLPLE